MGQGFIRRTTLGVHEGMDSLLALLEGGGFFLVLKGDCKVERGVSVGVSCVDVDIAVLKQGLENLRIQVHCGQVQGGLSLPVLVIDLDLCAVEQGFDGAVVAHCGGKVERGLAVLARQVSPVAVGFQQDIKDLVVSLVSGVIERTVPRIVLVHAEQVGEGLALAVHIRQQLDHFKMAMPSGQPQRMIALGVSHGGVDVGLFEQGFDHAAVSGAGGQMQCGFPGEVWFRDIGSIRQQHLDTSGLALEGCIVQRRPALESLVLTGVIRQRLAVVLQRR